MSSLFSGWTGLERQVLVRAINSSPGTVDAAAAMTTKERSTGGSHRRIFRRCQQQPAKPGLVIGPLRRRCGESLSLEHHFGGGLLPAV